MRALLIVDLQRWFLEVGSEEKLRLVSNLIMRTNELIRHFESNNLPIIKIQTVHKADKSTWNQWAIENDAGRLIEGSKEAEYAPEVHVAKDELIITKTRLSAFLRTNLEGKLRELKCSELVICGYSTDNCVGQTAIDAYELDFKIILAGEAILGTQIKYGELMLDSLKRRFEITPLSNKEIIESLVRNVD